MLPEFPFLETVSVCLLRSPLWFVYHGHIFPPVLEPRYSSRFSPLASGPSSGSSCACPPFLSLWVLFSFLYVASNYGSLLGLCVGGVVETLDFVLSS